MVSVLGYHASGRAEGLIQQERDRARHGAGKAWADLMEVGDALVVAHRKLVRQEPEGGTRPATVVTFREG